MSQWDIVSQTFTVPLCPLASLLSICFQKKSGLVA